MFIETKKRRIRYASLFVEDVNPSLLAYNELQQGTDPVDEPAQAQRDENRSEHCCECRKYR